MQHHSPRLRLAVILDLSLEHKLHHASFFRPDVIVHSVAFEEADDLPLCPFRIYLGIRKRKMFRCYHLLRASIEGFPALSSITQEPRPIVLEQGYSELAVDASSGNAAGPGFDSALSTDSRPASRRFLSAARRTD